MLKYSLTIVAFKKKKKKTPQINTHSRVLRNAFQIANKTAHTGLE